MVYYGTGNLTEVAVAATNNHDAILTLREA